MRILLLAVIGMLTATPAQAASLLDDLRAQFDPSAAKLKKKLDCKTAWEKKRATTPTGKSYTIEVCPDENQQVMSREEQVFAVGLDLANRTDSRRADAKMKEAQTELSKRCKEVRKAGQLAFYDCPGSFSIAILYNWNSKDDTNTVSALFGDTAALHSMIGIK